MNDEPEQFKKTLIVALNDAYESRPITPREAISFCVHVVLTVMAIAVIFSL